MTIPVQLLTESIWLSNMSGARSLMLPTKTVVTGGLSATSNFCWLLDAFPMLLIDLDGAFSMVAVRAGEAVVTVAVTWGRITTAKHRSRGEHQMKHSLFKCFRQCTTGHYSKMKSLSLDRFLKAVILVSSYTPANRKQSIGEIQFINNQMCSIR